MSLAELPRTRTRSGGIAAKRRLPWMEIRIKEEGSILSLPKEEAETLPPPVDSKDLFREAATLPTSEHLQLTFGRFLYHDRNKAVHNSQEAWSELLEARPSIREQWKVSAPVSFKGYLDELRHALGVTATTAQEVSLPEFVALLKRVLTTIESSTLSVSETRTVLESFDGYVDSIEGDTAYVTLESRENGDVFYGEYSAPELLAKGIREQTRFLCETVKGGGGDRVHFTPLPKLTVTNEEARAIAKEMREAFPGDDDSVIEY